jgi:FMN reductase
MTEGKAMKKQPIIAGLGGSLRASSYSRAALKAALDIAEAQGAKTELLDVRILDLPFFIPDLPVGAYPPRYQPSITHLINVCRDASGMIWSSPTYHGTVSGVFKNAVDFLELLIDERPPYLQGHAVGLMTVPDSSAFAAMVDSVHELRAWLAPTRVVVKEDDFTVDFALNNERTQRRITRLVDELLGFVQQ